MLSNEFLLEMLAESRRDLYDHNKKNTELLKKYEDLINEAARLRISNLDIFEKNDRLSDELSNWQRLASLRGL